MWVLLVVYMKMGSVMAISMQDFNSRETCQAAGAKIWELSGREVRWSCEPK